jgi:prepilin-type processing-associated H-X9-DG protein
LPFLEENELHEQFKLDQPWDSKVNKKLLAMMPKAYTAPSGTFEKGHTFYQAFAGAGTMMSGKPTKPVDVTDGLSNTVMVVEAGEAVPWTKPADIAFDPAKPLPKLGGIFDGDFNALFGDGSVRFLKKGIKEANLKKFITIAGAERTTEKDLEP